MDQSVSLSASTVERDARFPARFAARAAALALPLCGFLLSGPASAATLTVNSVADDIPVMAGNGACTLREAIGAINGGAATADCPNTGAAFGTGDTIVFAAAINGQPILTRDQFVISKPMTIAGNGAANTVLDVLDNLNSPHRFFRVNQDIGVVNVANSGGFALRSLTLQNGRCSAAALGANDCDGDDVGGGAIFLAQNAQVDLDNDTFLIIENSVVRNNRTVGSLLMDGDVDPTGGVVPGGAIRSINASVIIVNSTLSGNSTNGVNSGGGAIFSDTGAVSVSGSTFSDNSVLFGDADGGNGGAIRTGGGALSIVNSTISGNDAFRSGGGIFVSGPGRFLLVNSTVTNNTATGIIEDVSTGGIHHDGAGDVILHNSIVAGNFASEFPDLRFGADLDDSVRNNLIGDNTGTNLAAAPVGAPDGNGNLIGTAVSPIDPLLGPLANNGGRTGTHALRKGSPALDAGNNGLAVDLANMSLEFDQRGSETQNGVPPDFLRIMDSTTGLAGGIVDMGAFEARAGGRGFGGGGGSDCRDFLDIVCVGSVDPGTLSLLGLLGLWGLGRRLGWFRS